ncbi:hypothetical protein WSM22_45720 [Cytophagales bacterium WSM2-2]|nr:hypothetical protein WSM22_45720 [Cytophagales bacterium WSM2-2]
MESGKVVLGVIAGVAIGAVLGILFAPEKGSVTRGQILGKGEDFAKGFDDFMKAASKNYASLLKGAEELSIKEIAKLEHVKNETQSATT